MTIVQEEHPVLETRKFLQVQKVVYRWEEFQEEAAQESDLSDTTVVIPVFRHQLLNQYQRNTRRERLQHLGDREH